MTREDITAMAGVLVDLEEENISKHPECLDDSCDHDTCPDWQALGCGDAERIVHALNLAGWYLTRDQKDLAARLAELEAENDLLDGQIRDMADLAT